MNSTISDSEFGILVYQSSNVSINGQNNLTNNAYYGIEILHSSHVNVSNGVFYRTSGNLSALAIIHSSYNTLYMNSFNDNTIYLRGGKETFTTQTIPENNFVNGGVVAYYKNADLSSVTIPNYAAEIILGNVTNASISGMGGLAFETGYSRNISFKDGNLQYGKIAIYLENVENATIENNNCSDTMIGLAGYYVNHSMIENNEIYATHWSDGMYLNGSSWNNISYNVVSGSKYVGVEVEESSNNSLWYNTFMANNYDNLFFYESNDNVVEDNNLSESKEYHGIGMEYSDGNKIVNNTMWQNKWDGIWIGDSKNNLIKTNHINYNAIGAYMVGANKNTFLENVFSNNTGYGIQIASGSYNRIYNNSFLFNHGSSGKYDPNNVQALDNGTYNYWNTTSGFGNYWYDWANNNDTNDKKAPYGIVDWPYKIDGTAKAEDYYPLTTGNAAVPEFNDSLIIILAGLLFMGIFRRRRA